MGPSLLVVPLLALWPLVAIGCAASGADSASTLAGPPPSSSVPGSPPDGGGAPEVRPASCKGALTRATFAYEPEWGLPISSFVEGDEELVFFNSCTLVRLDAASGAVRGAKRVCSEPAAVAVARDADGFWLATSHRKTSSNDKGYQELRLTLLDRHGVSTMTSLLGTSGAYESLLVFPSKTHVALTATMERTLGYRALVIASKADLGAGDKVAGEYADPYPDSNLFDVVRWRDDGIEGFRPPKRGEGPGRRYLVSSDGKSAKEEDAPFYRATPGTCQVTSPRFFGHENTVFTDGDVRFVALESATCPGDQAFTAQVTMRSPSGGTTKTDLATLVAGAGEKMHLCLGSSAEAVVVRTNATDYKLDRFRYDLAPVPAFAASLPPLAAVSSAPLCPVPTADGYLAPTVEQSGSVRVTRLRCAQ